MQVLVESPSKLQRRLTVTVPFEALDTAFEKRIKQLAKTAKVKGFRPGNVPVSHIKKMYGNAARQEALTEVIQSSLYEAITQEKLQPVGAPQVEPKSLTPGKPLEFIATFEVLPEIGGVEFKATTIEKQVSTISDADVDRVVERLREQYIDWKEVSRPAADKDKVVIDFRGTIDGKVFAGGEAHEYPVVIGSKTMIPGFEDGLIGLTAGTEKTLTLTFPKEYFAAEMAGKTVEFAIKAHKVLEPIYPELNAELVKKFGIANGELNDLRNEIKKNLDREVERIVKTKLKNKVFDLLIEQNTLEVPATMVEQEAKRIHDEMHPHHKGHEHNHTTEEMATFNDAAKRNVILGLLVGELIKKHNLKPDTARVQKHITTLAAAYENPAEVVKWYNSDKRRLAEIEMIILEEQIIEKLLEGVTLNEKMLNYSDLIAN